mgnify:CR=1 FL=1
MAVAYTLLMNVLMISDGVVRGIGFNWLRKGDFYLGKADLH